MVSKLILSGLSLKCLVAWRLASISKNNADRKIVSTTKFTNYYKQGKGITVLYCCLLMRWICLPIIIISLPIIMISLPIISYNYNLGVNDEVTT